jgi:hypothetical protein
VEKEIRASDSSDDAGDRERDHDAARNVQVLAIGAGARGNSNPECNRVGRIGGDRSNTGEQQRGKGNETSASRYSVERSAKRSGDKEEDYGLRSHE